MPAPREAIEEPPRRADLHRTASTSMCRRARWASRSGRGRRV